jgi:hypothetical protein
MVEGGGGRARTSKGATWHLRGGVMPSNLLLKAGKPTIKSSLKKRHGSMKTVVVIIMDE